MTSEDSTREALLVLDIALNVRAANKAFYTMFRLAPEECVGHKVYELGGRAWDEKLRPMLETVLKGEPQSDHFELIHDDKEGGHGVLWLNARLVPSADPDDATIGGALEPVATRRYDDHLGPCLRDIIPIHPDRILTRPSERVVTASE